MSAVSASEDRRSQTAAREEMTIRDARESDLPTIIDIYNTAIATRMSTAQLEPVTVESRRDWLKEHSPERHPFWVMECEGEVAGWLTLKPFIPRCAYSGTVEVSVYVDQRFRRRGVGRALLEEVIARSPALEISAMVGLIFAHNEPSLRLFEQLGFERWGLLPRVARLDDVERDLMIMGRACGALTRTDAASISQPQQIGNQVAPANESLALMHTLMQYRHEPIHAALQKIRDQLSMLHLDVIVLIYHFAKTCAGQIVEIGAFTGAATIAAALGTRDSGKQKTVIAIEPGGSVKHKRLGTKNILRDLESNLGKHGMAETVTLIKDYSFAPATISTIERALGSEKIGLFILDADGNVQRDIALYGDKLADGCWMIIDDYYGPSDNTKVTPTRAEVDALVWAGSLEPLGFYGWGTWVGRWRRSKLPRDQSRDG
jgi:L-amino acid N-acyltransferase YncA/predicted O-methyltransferase YrrM